MAHNYGATPDTTDYGSPIRHGTSRTGRTDEFGNPAQQGSTGETTNHAATGAEYGTGAGYGTHEGSAGSYGATGGGGDQYQGVPAHDVSSTDEFGNPVHNGLTDTGYTSTGALPSTGYGSTKGDSVVEHHGVPATLHEQERSLSSSSSEDDGQGGRRKKGLKEKIKHKLPGTKNDQYSHDTSANIKPYGGTTYTEEEDHHQEKEKKGMVGQIKEKLPGGGLKDDHFSHDKSAKTKPYGTAYAQGGEHGHPQGGQEEKKGMVGKIKEKLPCGGHKDEHNQYTHDTSPADKPYGGTKYTEEHQEKKGIMDKIKDKLPGGTK